MTNNNILDKVIEGIELRNEWRIHRTSETSVQFQHIISRDEYETWTASAPPTVCVTVVDEDFVTVMSENRGGGTVDIVDDDVTVDSIVEQTMSDIDIVHRNVEQTEHHHRQEQKRIENAETTVITHDI